MGQDTFADVALAYILYQLSCLRDPAASYGLMAGSMVALICVSVNMSQAQRVIFKRLRQLLEPSPYFKRYFPADFQAQKELRFPKAVWLAPVASSEQNVIGENVFGGVIDEANFQPVVENSKQGRGKGAVYDHAQVLFDALRRRMKSRFLGMPGKFMLVSSEQYPEDFIDRVSKQYADDPGVMVRQYAQWETRPKTFYQGETFQIEVGTDIRTTRILTGSEIDIVGEVMDVPIEFKRDFQTDPDGATRDIAGRSTLALMPFITDRQSIQDALDRSRQHPMTDTETTLQDGVRFVWERICERLPDDDHGNEVWRPKWFPERPRYVHIDLGLVNDKCFAAGTPVLMADGTVKPIEEVEVGDHVIRMDGQRGCGSGAPQPAPAHHRGESARWAGFPCYTRSPSVWSAEGIGWCAEWPGHIVKGHIRSGGVGARGDPSGRVEAGGFCRRAGPARYGCR